VKGGDKLGKSKRKSEKWSKRQVQIQYDYHTYQKKINEVKDVVSEIGNKPHPTTITDAYERLTELLKVLGQIKPLYKQSNYPHLRAIIVECRIEIESKIVETYDFLMHKTSSYGKIINLYHRVSSQRQQPDTSQRLRTALRRIEDGLFAKRIELEQIKKKKSEEQQKHEELAWKLWEEKLSKAETEKQLTHLRLELEEILKNKQSSNMKKILDSVLNKTKLKLSLIQQTTIKTPIQVSEDNSPKITYAIDGIDSAKAELIPFYNKALDELKRCNYQLHNTSKINIAVPTLNNLYPHIEIMFKNNSYAAILTAFNGNRMTVNSLANLPENNDYLWLSQVVILCHLADLTRKPMEIFNANNLSSHPPRKLPSKGINLKRFRKAVVVRQSHRNMLRKKKNSVSQKEGSLVTGYARRLPVNQKRSLKQSMLYAALTGNDPSVLDQYADGRSRTFVLEHFRNYHNNDRLDVIELVNKTGYTSLAKPVEIYLNAFFEKTKRNECIG
jgi:hypothetical protein